MECKIQEEVTPGPYSPAMPSTLQSESWRSGEESSSSSMSWGRSVSSCCNWVRRVTSILLTETQATTQAPLKPMSEHTQRSLTPLSEFLRLHMHHVRNFTWGKGEAWRQDYWLTAGFTFSTRVSGLYAHTSQLTNFFMDAPPTINTVLIHGVRFHTADLPLRIPFHLGGLTICPGGGNSSCTCVQGALRLW